MADDDKKKGIATLADDQTGAAGPPDPGAPRKSDDERRAAFYSEPMMTPMMSRVAPQPGPVGAPQYAPPPDYQPPNLSVSFGEPTYGAQPPMQYAPPPDYDPSPLAQQGTNAPRPTYVPPPDYQPGVQIRPPMPAQPIAQQLVSAPVVRHPMVAPDQGRTFAAGTPPPYLQAPPRASGRDFAPAAPPAPAAAPAPPSVGQRMANAFATAGGHPPPKAQASPAPSVAHRVEQYLASLRKQ